MLGGKVPMVMSFNWYRREDYPRILEIMEDRDKLSADYDTWLKGAETGLKHMQDKGVTSLKVEIRPEPFLAWCRERGCKVDAAARNEYSSGIAIEIHRKKSGH